MLLPGNYEDLATCICTRELVCRVPSAKDCAEMAVSAGAYEGRLSYRSFECQFFL